MKCQFYILFYVDKYFSCLHMYSAKFFNIYFHELIFFKIYVAKGNKGQFLRNNSLWTLQFSLTNLQVIFQRNENRFISLVLKAKQLKGIQLQ